MGRSSPKDNFELVSDFKFRIPDLLNAMSIASKSLTDSDPRVASSTGAEHGLEVSERNLSVYILRQYLSTANRRELQLLSLEPRIGPIRIWHQAQGNRFGVRSDAIVTINKWPNPTGVFSRVGLGALKRQLDQVYFPSPTCLYVKPAVSVLSRAVRRGRSDGRSVCLITPVPPHGLVLAGLRLKQRHPEIRWVIDWQDLWSHDESYFCNVPSHWRRRALALERQVIRTCDLNVVTNDRAARVLVERYGALPENVKSIAHAFEEDLCSRLPVADGEMHVSDPPIRIGFLGSLFKPPKVPGDRVMAALDTVCGKGVAFEFHIYGDKYIEQVTRAPLNGRPWAVFHPRQPHERSLAAIANSDWLLLTLADTPNTRVTLHGKLPYYLALGKPILALVPNDSAVADVIRATGAGCIISPSENWADGLAEILKQNKSSEIAVSRNEERIADYAWKHVSKQWLAAINPENTVRSA